MDYNKMDYIQNPSDKPDSNKKPIDEMPQDIIPDEVPRRDGPGGEDGEKSLDV